MCQLILVEIAEFEEFSEIHDINYSDVIYCWRKLCITLCKVENNSVIQQKTKCYLCIMQHTVNNPN